MLVSACGTPQALQCGQKLRIKLNQKVKYWGFSGGPVLKNTCNAGDTGFDSWFEEDPTCSGATKSTHCNY